MSGQRMDTAAGIRIACAGMDRALFPFHLVIPPSFFLSLSPASLSLLAHPHTYVILSRTYKHTAAVIPPTGTCGPQCAFPQWSGVGVGAFSARLNTRVYIHKREVDVIQHTGEGEEGDGSFRFNIVSGAHTGHGSRGSHSLSC